MRVYATIRVNWIGLWRLCVAVSVPDGVVFHSYIPYYSDRVIRVYTVL